MGLFERMKEGLKKTREGILRRMDQTLASFGKIDDELFEELEEILISSDVGMDTSLGLIGGLKEQVRRRKLTDPMDIRSLLKEEMTKLLYSSDAGSTVDQVTNPISGLPGLDLAKKPAVIMIIGVNGAGKTTTIAKLAYLLKSRGLKVLLAAGDTFRAAAIDQLDIWARRAGVDMIRHEAGSDPAAVLFDSARAARARNADVLICDTAGRLHTKKNLMEELAKMNRVLERELPEASRETLLILDATTGQNAMAQARAFNEMVQLTGIILTKLDGTARGGILFAICKELRIPVKYIGIGEKMEDLEPFDPAAFTDALFARD
ncbi:MAG TPA: signal recognition particle-docking protein FtsY [Clostridiales bacterium]|nr:signal recognition particle-docking protein FtsY [Clostridiales bacterium]